MSEWKIACVLKSVVDKGQAFVFFTVEGETKEFRKTSNELKKMGISQEMGTKFEVTLKMGDKGSLKVDQYRKNSNSIPKSPTQANNRILPTNPYAFMPIDLASAVKDAPVWHDGSSEVKTYTGELHCTLTALTPLLVGNQRFTVADAIQNQLPAEIRNSDEKAILEPLRLKDGRVLLPGSSLKGMLRQQLAGLLNAPMDRVKEQHYTYRPNLDFTNEKKKYDVRPAIVVQINNQQIAVKVLPNVQNVIFCRSDFETRLTPGHSADQLENADWKRSIDRRTGHEKVDHSRIVSKPKNTLELGQNYTVFKYYGGIDGEGKFAQAFNDGKVHRVALVAESSIPNDEMMVPIPVYAAYLKTQQVLADDKDGHLSAHPLHKHFQGDVAQAIKNATSLQVNQLIYVEVELDGKNPKQITSMGHHFRYRWAYNDSIRYRNDIQDKAKVLRPELDASSLEQDGQLTGAHLLFGFAGNKLSFDEQSIDKLAGRIAINHAVSDANPPFLNDKDQHCWVFLNILGQPKASAVEHYLKQPEQGLMQTYGDLPGQAGGELAGRKVYRHQKNAASNLSRYPAPSDEIRNSDQATLARYVSAPSSQFKFSVRFARLRDWELGALIAALNPQRLKENAKADDYALKLGYGRPLGLGSVNIAIDACWLQGLNVKDLEREFAPWINAAKGKLSASTIDRWLGLLRYQDGNIAYPTKPETRNGREEITIFNYHTAIRSQHSKDRRKV